MWEEDAAGSSKRHVYLGNTLLARVDIDAGGAPIAPASITVTPEANTAGVNTGTLQVSWLASASSGAITYQLERKLCTVAPTEVCAGWVGLPIATPSSLQFTQLDSSEGGRMQFRVVACTAKVCGTDWRVSTAYDHSPPKTSITELPAKPQPSSFSISWGAAIGANAYDVQRSIDAGTWSTQALNQTVLSATVTPTGTVNASYRFRVRAKFNGKTRGYSAESAPVLYQPITTCVPVAPGSLIASPNQSSDGNFSLSWGASSCGALRYLVEEKIGAGAFALLTETSSSALALSRANGSYQYRVQACKPPPIKGGASECSAYSSPVIVTVQIVCTPAAPSNLQVNPSVSTNGNFTLGWGVSTCGATRFTVEESLDGGEFFILSLETTALNLALNRANGSYQYRIRACTPVPPVGNVACSSASTIASVSVQIPGGLSAPTGLQCRTGGTGGVQLNCDRFANPTTQPRTQTETARKTARTAGKQRGQPLFLNKQQIITSNTP